MYSFAQASEKDAWVRLCIVSSIEVVVLCYSLFLQAIYKSIHFNIWTQVQTHLLCATGKADAGCVQALKPDPVSG